MKINLLVLESLINSAQDISGYIKLMFDEINTLITITEIESHNTHLDLSEGFSAIGMPTELTPITHNVVMFQPLRTPDSLQSIMITMHYEKSAAAKEYTDLDQRIKAIVSQYSGIDIAPEYMKISSPSYSK